MILGSTFLKRSMAVFAFILAFGAFDVHDYISGVVLCFAVAIALCEPTYWFSQTLPRRSFAFICLVLLAAELGTVHWNIGA